MFSWGSGIYGQLGHGNLRDRFSPLMIGAPLRGIGITLVACHEYHSAAVAGVYVCACACACACACQLCGGGLEIVPIKEITQQHLSSIQRFQTPIKWILVLIREALNAYLSFQTMECCLRGGRQALTSAMMPRVLNRCLHEEWSSKVK